VRPTVTREVLPFGISINITDMATFLMFAKSVDRMDALLSQNPWNMFADPNAILAQRIVHGHVGGWLWNCERNEKYIQLPATTARN
jgi:hypothetical protein